MSGWVPYRAWLVFVVLGATSLAVGACGRGHAAAPETSAESQAPPSAPRPSRTLTFAAYSTPREVYGELLRRFQRDWAARTGETLQIRESYGASGAQARAVVGGLEADVIALSLEEDVRKVADAGLIVRDFRELGRHRGMASESIVVFVVRQGNPKGIHEWDDLRRSDVDVLMPNVRTSGGARWNVAALHGAALRRPDGDAREARDAATSFLADVLRRVRVMDRSARESLETFESGVGDVAITYENEWFAARARGQTCDVVIPRSTLLIENPIAVVDRYVDRHGTRDVAEAFVRYVGERDAQLLFARRGYRPVEPLARADTERIFPAVEDLFTVRDLGGWDELERTLFGRGASYDVAASVLSHEGR